MCRSETMKIGCVKTQLYQTFGLGLARFFNYLSITKQRPRIRHIDIVNHIKKLSTTSSVHRIKAF